MADRPTAHHFALSGTAGIHLADSAGARARAYARARNHSRFVRLLRVVLPASSLVLAGWMAAIGLMPRDIMGIKFDGAELTREGLGIAAPHLAGSDANGRHYTVTSERAVEDISGSNIIHLYNIHAIITEANGLRSDVTAGKGLYDPPRQKLTLEESIKLTNSDGQAADLHRAEIDLATGAMASDKPVAFSSGLGAIHADTMTVDQKEKTVRFKERVIMTVNPKSGQRTNSQTSQPLSETQGH